MRGWSTIDWLNYAPQSHFDVGIGPGLGYNNADFGPDPLNNSRPGSIGAPPINSVSSSMEASRKPNSSAVRRRQYLQPLYGGTIQYSPFAETQISAYANESLSPSVFVGEYRKTLRSAAPSASAFSGNSMSTSMARTAMPTMSPPPRMCWPIALTIYMGSPSACRTPCWNAAPPPSLTNTAPIAPPSPAIPLPATNMARRLTTASKMFYAR